MLMINPYASTLWIDAVYWHWAFGIIYVLIFIAISVMRDTKCHGPADEMAVLIQNLGFSVTLTFILFLIVQFISHVLGHDLGERG